MRRGRQGAVWDRSWPPAYPFVLRSGSTRHISTRGCPTLSPRGGTYAPPRINPRFRHSNPSRYGLLQGLVGSSEMTLWPLHRRHRLSLSCFVQNCCQLVFNVLNTSFSYLFLASRYCAKTRSLRIGAAHLILLLKYSFPFLVFQGCYSTTLDQSWNCTAYILCCVVD